MCLQFKCNFVKYCINTSSPLQLRKSVPQSCKTCSRKPPLTSSRSMLTVSLKSLQIFWTWLRAIKHDMSWKLWGESDKIKNKEISVFFSGSTREKSSIAGNIKRLSRATAEFVSKHTCANLIVHANNACMLCAYIILDNLICINKVPGPFIAAEKSRFVLHSDVMIWFPHRSSVVLIASLLLTLYRVL